MTSRLRSKKSGFTLLEVLISIALLVVISFGIYRATSDTYKLRAILSVDGEFYNGIRMAFSMIEKDVSMVYNPLIFLPPDPKKPKGTQPQIPAPGSPEEQELQAMTQGDRDKGSEYWGSIVDKTGLRVSRFHGTDNSMTFITLSNLRVYKDTKESYFAKVSYSSADDKNPLPDIQGQALVRTISTNAFHVEKDGEKELRRYVLLQGVQNFKIRYYRKDKDQWLSAWDSDSQDLRGLYPDVIEFTVRVAGPQHLSFEGLYKFRTEIPLNGILPST